MCAESHPQLPTVGLDARPAAWTRSGRPNARRAPLRESLSMRTSDRSLALPIRGFTLLELLVVMVIIGLLAGFVAPRYFAQVGKSQVKVAKAQIDALDKAIEQFRIDVGRLPTTEEGL